MDGVSLSDVPRIVLLLSIPILLVGVPTYWAVYHRASFDSITRRFRLNRFTVFAAIFFCWAIENGLARRWISTVILGVGALYFLWYSRRAPRAASHNRLTLASPLLPSINSESAQTSASARSGERPGPS